MKFFAILALAFTAAACCSQHTYTVPEGYQTCASDLYCPRGYYCGFVGVDTYAVCKPR